jgi:signal transduction histidine kinase
MKIELKSFRTKVARRIFLLFIASAVVPILALAWVSFTQVSGQLRAQGRDRLVRDTKNIGMSILERVALLELELRVVASSLGPVSQGAADPVLALPQSLGKHIEERFAQLALLLPDGHRLLLLGRGEFPETLSPADMRHLSGGKAVLRCGTGPNGPPALYLYVLLDPGVPRRGVLMAEINPGYLWQVAEARPADTELTVLDRAHRTLFTSSPDRAWNTVLPSDHAGSFESSTPEGPGMAAYWSLYLESSFASPPWIAILWQSRATALAPMDRFKTAFPLILMMSLCVVCLLSARLIRQQTVPIEILKEATQRIARGAFGDKVPIRSGDEFESLGDAFNEMSQKLEEGQRLLVQAAKLSTMGQMAAGVIHEIKQPLTAIHGLVQLVLLTETAPVQRKRLEMTFQAIESLDAILERFRAFSRPAAATMAPLSLGQVADQVCGLLEHQFLMSKVRWRIEADDALPLVMGDQQGLRQVFSNLLVNAIHAMEDTPEARRALHIRLRSSQAAVIAEIQDTGCGMPPEVVARIFDPFFTTKREDKGTGLGMAIVAAILHQHGAAIEVASAVGIGTTFTLRFAARAAERAPLPALQTA